MGQHGYTPLVEVNQAVIAWSYRQTLPGHTEAPIKTKFLSQMTSSDLKRSGFYQLEVWAPDPPHSMTL